MHCIQFGSAEESKNRSTEGCSKLKSPQTRQVQEILVSKLYQHDKHMVCRMAGNVYTAMKQMLGEFVNNHPTPVPEKIEITCEPSPPS